MPGFSSKAVKLILFLNFLKLNMKFLKLLLLVNVLAFMPSIYAERVDSFQISHTDIHLSVRKFATKSIAGHVEHNIVFKVQTNRMVLDLSGMTIDSVKISAATLVYSRLKDKLSIMLDKTYNPNDSCRIKIYYHGTPASDPTGWGGFYFSGDHAFNLGVGFGVDPHSFGRAWFPCVDEFTMKSSYDLWIETDSGFTAACNGVLKDVNDKSSSVIWHYSERQPMSAYLASVSVSRYSILKSDYKGMASDFPVWLFCKAVDSINVKKSFVNLPKAIQAFESAFGPQLYGKVGYNFVPFTQGAMEHAGNITYPRNNADGTTNNETLLAHELSHHWWGNNVTCADEGDMWLNEGWASYCEHFFVESVYGKAAYKNSVLQNHLYVLRRAHITDGQPYPMVNIPHDKTYGDHVYKKGADMVHSLRGIVGDSVFFKACKAYQTDYRFKNASTSDLQAVFEQNGGGPKVAAFFDNWIREKGFPHVIISKQVHSGNGPFQLKIFTTQAPRFTNKLYNNMTVEVFFFRDHKTWEKRIVNISNLVDSFVFTFDFKPVYVCLDYDEKLSDAITDRFVHTGEAGTFDFPETFSQVIVRQLTDSALVRVEHHWVGPELYRTSAPYMSNYRYHTLDGIWGNDVQMDLEMLYDGRNGMGATANLDHTLIFKTEDSLTVLYRAFPGDYWRVWPELQFTYGNSKNDKTGKVLVKNARRGDYVFAMYDKSLDMPVYELNPSDEDIWTISPNPASDKVLLSFLYPELPTMSSYIHVYDQSGKKVFSAVRQQGQKYVNIDIHQWQAGVYTVMYSGKAFHHSKKLVIHR
jgi:hypothetical protein